MCKKNIYLQLTDQPARHYTVCVRRVIPTGKRHRLRHS